MAEFMEVIKQTVRMCREHERCDGCPIETYTSGSCPFFRFMDRAWTSEDIERVIMAWAAEHPEHVYPSWQEAWKQLFPECLIMPCVKMFMSEEESGCTEHAQCHACLARPIRADIAEKLGIKPVEG